MCIELQMENSFWEAVLFYSNIKYIISILMNVRILRLLKYLIRKLESFFFKYCVNKTYMNFYIFW